MARIKNIRVISEIRGQKVSPSNQRAHVAELLIYYGRLVY